METFFGKPYNDQENIRIFDVLRDESEYVWHRDKEDRIIKVLDGIGWKIQYDNCLPRSLYVNEEYFIPKMVYHRVIKGTNNLTIEIKRLYGT